MTCPDLSQWWNSPLGELLETQERRVVAEALEDAFGLQLLQLGEWGRAGTFFEGARTQRQNVITGAMPEGRAIQNAIIARAGNLPVAADAVDAVLLPHTLEFESDPYVVLREASRVLVGDGKLLILGFTSFGPWALRHRMGHDSFPPGLKRFVAPRRLREWLRVLSFEVTETRRYLFRLPTASGRKARWPVPAGAYLLKAHKRVYTLTPLRPRRREKFATPVGALVGSSPQ